MHEEDILVIDREKWGQAKLKRKADGKMCCLGFACIKAGFGANTIMSLNMPNEAMDAVSNPKTKLKSIKKKFPAFESLLKVRIKDGALYFENTAFARSAAFINDSEKITDKVRETRLTKLFGKYGITLKFINKRYGD